MFCYPIVILKIYWLKHKSRDYPWRRIHIKKKWKKKFKENLRFFLWIFFTKNLCTVKSNELKKSFLNMCIQKKQVIFVHFTSLIKAAFKSKIRMVLTLSIFSKKLEEVFFFSSNKWTHVSLPSNQNFRFLLMLLWPCFFLQEQTFFLVSIQTVAIYTSSVPKCKYIRKNFIYLLTRDSFPALATTWNGWPNNDDRKIL